MRSCSGVVSNLKRKRGEGKEGVTSFSPLFVFLTYFYRFLLFCSLTVLYNLVFIINIFHLGIVTNSEYTSPVTFLQQRPISTTDLAKKWTPQQYIFHCINLFLFCSAGMASVMSPYCSNVLPLLARHTVGCVTCCWVHLTRGRQTGHRALCGFLCRQMYRSSACTPSKSKKV